MIERKMRFKYVDDLTMLEEVGVGNLEVITEFIGPLSFHETHGLHLGKDKINHTIIFMISATMHITTLCSLIKRNTGNARYQKTIEQEWCASLYCLKCLFKLAGTGGR
jgi:hypothetical protein